MSNSPFERRYKVSEVVEAIRRGETVVGAAKILGCVPDTVRSYAKKFPAVNDSLKEIREQTVDFAEMGLRERVKAGDGWAISMALRTLGRDRGYAEKIETNQKHEITGKDGAPININLRNMSNEQLIAIATGGAKHTGESPEGGESD
jgi:hypothetical protein